MLRLGHHHQVVSVMHYPLTRCWCRFQIDHSFALVILKGYVKGYISLKEATECKHVVGNVAETGN